jgi:hypothetical protein
MRWGTGGMGNEEGAVALVSGKTFIIIYTRR